MTGKSSQSFDCRPFADVPTERLEVLVEKVGQLQDGRSVEAKTRAVKAGRRAGKYGLEQVRGKSVDIPWTDVATKTPWP